MFKKRIRFITCGLLESMKLQPRTWFVHENINVLIKTYEMEYWYV